MNNSLKAGGRVLIFGNGGSAADAQHFAAELVGRFILERAPLSAISLSTDSSILTALLDGGVRKTFADLDHYAAGESHPD